MLEESLIAQAKRLCADRGVTVATDNIFTEMGRIFVAKAPAQCDDASACVKMREAYKRYKKRDAGDDLIAQYQSYAQNECVRFSPEVDVFFPLRCAKVPVFTENVTLDLLELVKIDRPEKGMTRAVYDGAIWSGVDGEKRVSVWVDVNITAGSAADVRDMMAANLADSALRFMGHSIDACSPYMRFGETEGAPTQYMANWVIETAGKNAFVQFALRKKMSSTVARYIDDRIDQMSKAHPDATKWGSAVLQMTDALSLCVAARCEAVKAKLAQSAGQDLSAAPIPIAISAEDYAVDVDGGPGVAISIELDCWNHKDVLSMARVASRPEATGPSRIAAPNSGDVPAYYAVYSNALFQYLMWKHVSAALQRNLYAELNRIKSNSPLERFEKLRELMVMAQKNAAAVSNWREGAEMPRYAISAEDAV